LLVGSWCILCLALFLIWRIDSPRVERLRAQVVDTVVPNMEWAMAPVTGLPRTWSRDFQSYAADLRTEPGAAPRVAADAAWREAALQLEQENAGCSISTTCGSTRKLTFVTGVVLADSGSPFRQSVLLNVGRRDGIVDGWATMDGLGSSGGFRAWAQHRAGDPADRRSTAASR
jgi:rod shape-determining protein MreC